MESFPLFRVFKTGFVNFTRNLWLSATATMVMVVTLFILATLLLLFGITNYSVKTIQEKVDISVYFKNGLADSRISAIQDEITANPLVREVKFTSAQQAFDEFKAKHAGDPLIKQSLDELAENPLPATINIKANKLEDYPAIAEQLNDAKYKDFVTKVNYEDNRDIIQRLSKILRIIVTFGSILVGVFGVIAVLVVFNTITLTIYNRREEVEIMRLVGATNWYIRGPFLAESMLYSILATIITAAVFYPIFKNVLPKISLFIDPSLKVLDQNIFNFGYLVLMLFVVSVIISVISSTMAIRKYLKI